MKYSQLLKITFHAKQNKTESDCNGTKCYIREENRLVSMWSVFFFAILRWPTGQQKINQRNSFIESKAMGDDWLEALAKLYPRLPCHAMPYEICFIAFLQVFRNVRSHGFFRHIEIMNTTAEWLLILNTTESERKKRFYPENDDNYSMYERV